MSGEQPNPPEPVHGVEVVRLRDGSQVTVRAVEPDDEGALGVFLAGLCPETRRLRFFSAAADTSKAARWAAHTGAGHHGLLAHDELGVLVAHAAYARLGPDRAEVAVEVADHLHDRGLGTMLIERLAALAEKQGITGFLAEVLRENRAMLDVFSDGFDAERAPHDGSDMVEFPTASWRLARERFSA